MSKLTVLNLNGREYGAESDTPDNPSRRKFLINTGKIFGGSIATSILANCNRERVGIDVEHDAKVPPLDIEALDKLPLIDQYGNAFKFSDYKDRPVLLQFGWTRCPLTCPPLSDGAGRLNDDMNKLGIPVFFISVDPYHDQPAALKNYAELHGIKPVNDKNKPGAENCRMVTLKAEEMDGSLPAKTSQYRKAAYQYIQKIYSTFENFAGMGKNYAALAEDALPGIDTDLGNTKPVPNVAHPDGYVLAMNGKYYREYPFRSYVPKAEQIEQTKQISSEVSNDARRLFSMAGNYQAASELQAKGGGWSKA